MEQDEKALIVQSLRDKHLGKDLVEELIGPTPAEYIWQRPARGGSIVNYIPGSYFIQKLDACFGFLWDFDVTEHFREDNQIVAKGKLTVKIPGQTIVREYPDGRKETIIVEGIEISKTQFGGQEVKRYSKDLIDKQGFTTHKRGDIIDLADDYKGAATDAMKKCSTLLGIGLDIYGSRGREAQEEKVATATHLEALYMRGSNAGMSREEVDEFCVKEEGGTPDTLSQIVVLGLIGKLIEKEKEAKGG